MKRVHQLHQPWFDKSLWSPQMGWSLVQEWSDDSARSQHSAWKYPDGRPSDSDRKSIGHKTSDKSKYAFILYVNFESQTYSYILIQSQSATQNLRKTISSLCYRCVLFCAFVSFIGATLVLILKCLAENCICVQRHSFRHVASCGTMCREVTFYDRISHARRLGSPLISLSPGPCGAEGLWPWDFDEDGAIRFRWVRAQDGSACRLEGSEGSILLGGSVSSANQPMLGRWRIICINTEGLISFWVSLTSSHDMQYQNTSCFVAESM